MPLMTWTPKLSVGVDVLDEDHRKLVNMLNDLYDAMQSGQGRDSLGRILDGLVQYTKMHFAREEKLFAQTGYPAAGPHRQEHEALKRQVIDVQHKYAAGATGTLSLEVMQFLRDWLVKHIQGSDQQYQSHFNSKGIR